MSENILNRAYEYAKARYAEFGVDTDAAIARVANIPVSIHCWQGDDVHGFLFQGELSGGIQTTGNYPGAARCAEELMADFDRVLALTPGKKRINLHAIYAITDEKVDLDALEYRHFEKWVNYAKERGIHIDFNPTCFSHPMVKDGLTLSSPDENVRAFWIRHVKACREISARIGREQGSPCLCNLWIGDGLKDVPADRMGPRMRLKASLDEIYSVKYPKSEIEDSVESKVFGIGVESYTVGNSEFYQAYAAKSGICCLMDNGHYHPTEVVSDKIPSMLCFYDKIALHVTRGVRWDSDHVVLLDDETREIAQEIIRNNADERVMIGLDYFDASINRVLAWVTGAQNMQKALLIAALTPNAQMVEWQNAGNFGGVMAMREVIKELPFGEVWNEYCRKSGVLSGMKVYEEILAYEKKILAERA